MKKCHFCGRTYDDQATQCSACGSTAQAAGVELGPVIERRGPEEGDTPSPANKDWRCPKCGEIVPGTFQICWNCSSTNPEMPAVTANAEAQLLDLVRQKLQSSGVRQVADVALEGEHLMTTDRRLAITTEIMDLDDRRVHAHVISWLPNTQAPDGKDKLEACVMGGGLTVDESMNQAAEVWLRLVGAPVLSCLAARPLLEADHFAGTEEWGVPGGHGFAGPFAVRGTSHDIDLDLLARSAAFLFEEYPRDECAHLVKATLIGRDGRWQRHLEIDGHAITHTDEEWFGLPSPVGRIVCTRFAVYMKT